MARRNITRLRFEVEPTQGAGTYTYFVDLWRALSHQERKMFRQMQVCHVVGGLVFDSNQSARVNFQTAPDTWPVRAAIRRGFRIWKRQRAKTLAEAESGTASGKYSDFKIYLNHQHGTSPLMPKDAAGNDLTAGEWDYTTLVTEDIHWDDPALIAGSDLVKDQFELQILGDAHITTGNPGQDRLTRVSLLKSWVDSRAQQDTSGQPVLPANFGDDPLMNLFNEADADDQVLFHINTEGDQPPYDEDTMFGMEQTNATGANMQRMAIAKCAQHAPISRFSGFSALCGLLQLELDVSGSGKVEILMDVLHDGDKI